MTIKKCLITNFDCEFECKEFDYRILPVITKDNARVHFSKFRDKESGFINSFADIMQRRDECKKPPIDQETKNYFFSEKDRLAEQFIRATVRMASVCAALHTIFQYVSLRTCRYRMCLKIMNALRSRTPHPQYLNYSDSNFVQIL